MIGIEPSCGCRVTEGARCRQLGRILTEPACMMSLITSRTTEVQRSIPVQKRLQVFACKYSRLQSQLASPSAPTRNAAFASAACLLLVAHHNHERPD